MASDTRPNPARVLATLTVLCGLSIAAHAGPKYKILHDFTNGPNGDGNAGVTVDAKGNVYGASLGGGSQNCEDGCGLIFQLSPHPDGKWTEGTVYAFPGGNGGEGPTGKPIFDGAGNMYGTTEYGGTSGFGTAFELSLGPDGWAESVLHSFCGPECGGVGAPQSGVIAGTRGTLYGTAGAAFELTEEDDGWKENVLHDFTGKDGDGEDAVAGLVRDAAGNLFGTTYFGGLRCGSTTCGTVYELSPEPGGKWKEAILHRFNGKDGQLPGSGSLYMDGSGALYGTTENGGAYGGVIFKLTPGNGQWTYEILYQFKGGAEGWLPDSGLIPDKDGNLYGTTDSGCGLIYKFSPMGKGKWKYGVLHRFGVGHDGCVPAGDLTIDSNGNLYGGTVLGGRHGFGTVYELTPDPAPSPQ
ncbi:MAG TPA: choice-of-anchor tandem repeat GloVer-containing protein [Terriglobales bacterium]